MYLSLWRLLCFLALEDIMTNRVASAYSMKWGGLLRGIVFCCLHAGKKDLALKIQLVSSPVLF